MFRGGLLPLVPADAGTQALPNPQSMRFGKGWIPASAGMSGEESQQRYFAAPNRR